MDAADPTERTDRNEPTLPTDSTEPTDPTESTDPLEAIDSTEPSDQSDHRELYERMLVIVASQVALRPSPPRTAGSPHAADSHLPDLALSLRPTWLSRSERLTA